MKGKTNIINAANHSVILSFNTVYAPATKSFTLEVSIPTGPNGTSRPAFQRFHIEKIEETVSLHGYVIRNLFVQEEGLPLEQKHWIVTEY